MIISFSDKDMTHVTTPHDDSFVITTIVEGFSVIKILVYGGSSTNIIFVEAFEKIGKGRVNVSLIGFIGCTKYYLRVINLLVVVGDNWKNIKIDETLFMVADTPSTYDTIL